MIRFIHRHLRLRNTTRRLLFWVIVFIVACSSLHVLTFVVIDRQKRLADTETNLQFAMRNQSVILENWAEDRAKEIRDLATLPLTKEVRLEKMAGDFQNFVRTHHDINSVVFIDREGYVLLDTAAENMFVNSDIQLSDRRYFIEARQGKPYMQELFTPSSDREPVIIFSAPVFSEANHFQGVVFGSVQLFRVNELLYQSIYGETGTIMLMNRDGQIVSYLAANTGVDRRMLTTSLEVSFFENDGADETLRKYVNHEQAEVFGKSRELLDGRYILVNEIRTSEVMQSHYSIVYVHLGITTLIVAVSIFLVVLLSRYLLAPYALLSRAIQRVKTGNFQTKLKPQLFHAAPDEVRNLMSVFNEMSTTIHENHRKLEQLSQTDALTGVYNRRMFDLLLEREWRNARREKQPLSLAFLDVDCFKEYNDTYGHQAGDECLQTISRVMKAHLQSPRDVIARYGGEEFVIIMPDTTLEDAAYVAENIRQDVEKRQIPNSASFNRPYVTVSIGVTNCMPNEEGCLKSLLHDADEALYEAKRSGRNRVVTKRQIMTKT